MKVPTTPREVDRVAARLMVTAAELQLLERRLRTDMDEQRLEDLRLTVALLKQVTDLLRRHARRWREAG